MHLKFRCALWGRFYFQSPHRCLFVPLAIVLHTTCTKESQVGKQSRGKHPQGLVCCGMFEMTVMPLLRQFGYRNSSSVSSQGEKGDLLPICVLCLRL